MTSTTGLVQSGTRTFVTGTASGIDTSALVEIAVQNVTRDADEIDVKIDENSSKISAYQELKSLTTAFQESLSDMSGNGTYSSTGGIFDARSGTLGSNNGTDPNGIITVGIDDTAEIGTYDIEVLQQAASHKVIGGTYADADADLGHAGTFDIGLAGGTTANIDITADMSLREIAAAINAEAGTTGVNATVLKTSETDYQLLLSGDQTALDIEVTNTTGDDVMNLIGVTDGGGGYNDVLQAAQTAQIRLDGATITRNSNNFNDLLEGVTLAVDNESPGTVFTLTVGNDTSAMRSQIESFMEAYNNLRDFITTNSQVNADGTVPEGSVLFSDNIMETLDLYMTNLLSGSAGSGSITSLRDIGLRLNEDLTLGYTRTPNGSVTLDTALMENLDDVKNFFNSSFTSDNPQLGLITNNSKQGSLSFAMDITVDAGGDITDVSVGGDNSLFTFDGSRIRGASGTIYEGLTFSYGGTSTTINVDLDQGFGTRLNNTLEDFTGSIDYGASGILFDEVNNLGIANEDLADEAQRIREIGEQVREREIARYAEMEARLQANKLLVRQIRAMFGTDDDDS